MPFIMELVVVVVMVSAGVREGDLVNVVWGIAVGIIRENTYDLQEDVMVGIVYLNEPLLVYILFYSITGVLKN